MKLNENSCQNQLAQILVVNDYLTVRKGLKSIVANFPGIHQCIGVENGLEAIEMMKKQHFDLVFLDLNMPIMDGTTTYYNIRKYFPSCKVIIASMREEKRQVIELVKAGIDGYLLVTAEEEELNTAVSKVMNGEKYFTRTVSDYWNDFNLLNEEEQNSFWNTSLSHREIEVIKCICDQMSAKQIAEHLNISEFTVNNHRSKIMKKLDVSNSVGLVVEAFRRGIISI
jgi:DNA-binding NarL/FixJ family response regulator